MMRRQGRGNSRKEVVYVELEARGAVAPAHYTGLRRLAPTRNTVPLTPPARSSARALTRRVDPFPRNDARRSRSGARGLPDRAILSQRGTRR